MHVDARHLLGSTMTWGETTLLRTIVFPVPLESEGHVLMPVWKGTERTSEDCCGDTSYVMLKGMVCSERSPENVPNTTMLGSPYLVRKLWEFATTTPYEDPRRTVSAAKANDASPLKRSPARDKGVEPMLAISMNWKCDDEGTTAASKAERGPG